MTRRVSRNCLHGYPWEEKFKTKSQVKEYLSHTKIRCLLCGRKYKGLAGHLCIHEVSVDEYKWRFGIPWTYGLVGVDTSALISSNSIKLVDEGKICKPEDLAKAQTMSGPEQQRKRCEVVIGIANEQIQSRNKRKGYDGTVRRKREKATKRGTPEYFELMRNRPQCHSPKTLKKLKTIWVGKKRDGERGKMIRNEI